MPQSTRKVIRGGRLLDARRHCADSADILIENDSIVKVGPAGLNTHEDAEVISAERRLMHPGLINGHTHGHGNLAKGMGDRWTLELLLVAGSWINGGRTLEDKYLTTYVGALEMLMKGCTACYDLTAESRFPRARVSTPAPKRIATPACGRLWRPWLRSTDLRVDTRPVGNAPARPAGRCGTLPAGSGRCLARQYASMAATLSKWPAWSCQRWRRPSHIIAVTPLCPAAPTFRGNSG